MAWTRSLSVGAFAVPVCGEDGAPAADAVEQMVKAATSMVAIALRVREWMDFDGVFRNTSSLAVFISSSLSC